MGKDIPHDNSILIQGLYLTALDPSIRRTEKPFATAYAKASAFAETAMADRSAGRPAPLSIWRGGWGEEVLQKLFLAQPDVVQVIRNTAVPTFQMIVSMVANTMTQPDHALKNRRMPAHVFSDAKKSSLGIDLFQLIERK